MSRAAPIALVLTLAATASCQESDDGGADAGPGRADGGADASRDAGFDAPPPGLPDAGPPPDGGPGPLVRCALDDAEVPMDGGPPFDPACSPTRSECVGLNWLVYWTGSVCGDDGTCRWTAEYYYCPLGCLDGGCSGGFT